MNIKDLETLTGVTKQNIRFYEKKGLLTPDRNPQNDYREYTEEDVTRLQTIIMFRKLEISIEDIRLMLNQQIGMGEFIEKHLKLLMDQQNHLKASIEICRQLADKDLDSINVPKVLEKMTEIEKRGGKFMDIMEDYRKVVESEKKKFFSFIPDTIVMNPREFTDALLKYAKDSKQDITITKESMYPEFELDGVEYVADRVIGRYGALIHCYMRHPETEEVDGIPKERQEKLKFVHKMIGPVIFWVIVLVIWAMSDFSLEFLVMALGGAAMWIAIMRVYQYLK